MLSNFASKSKKVIKLLADKTKKVSKRAKKISETANKNLNKIKTEFYRFLLVSPRYEGPPNLSMPSGEETFGYDKFDDVYNAWMLYTIKYMSEIKLTIVEGNEGDKVIKVTTEPDSENIYDFYEIVGTNIPISTYIKK